MRVGIIGAGRIGGNCARQFVKAGHDVLLSFAHDRGQLEAFARELGDAAAAGSPVDAVTFGEIVVFAVPWDVIPEAPAQAGSLQGKVVIDPTNQFGSGTKPGAGQTAAQFNAARMPGARYTKSFNTLTAAFQAEVAIRTGEME